MGSGPRCARLAAGLAVGLVLGSVCGGCASVLGPAIVCPPNRVVPLGAESNPLPPLESRAGIDRNFRVPVGDGKTSLSVSVLEPDKGYAEPKGTVLVIHGIYARSFWMMRSARMLAGAGYRAVLVDLRGHGRSSGEWLGYGVHEAKDLSAVIDELERRGLVTGKIGVFGVSYGATTSIHLAGHDPRVAAVVAVAPFCNMREEVPHFGRVMVPGVGWAIPEKGYQQAIDEAGRLGGFDPDRASALEAVRRTRAPVLIVHGTHDWVVPHEHGERLEQAAPDHTKLVSVPWHGHITAWLDPTGRVSRETRAWFDRWLAASPAAHGE